MGKNSGVPVPGLPSSLSFRTGWVLGDPAADALEEAPAIPSPESKDARVAPNFLRVDWMGDIMIAPYVKWIQTFQTRLELDFAAESLNILKRS
jgi:hypothetical protein